MSTWPHMVDAKKGRPEHLRAAKGSISLLEPRPHVSKAQRRVILHGKARCLEAGKNAVEIRPERLQDSMYVWCVSE